MKITAIRMRLPLDPPFHPVWDPVPRRHFDATLVAVQTDEGITGCGSGDTMDGFEPARAEAALAAKAAGFRALKIRISRTDPGSSLQAVRATRAAVGDDVAIMADLNQWWRMAGDLSPALDATQVRRIAAELAGLGVFWLEEPLPGGDLAGMRALRQQVRVAGGEMARTPAELLDTLAAGALDVLQPDVVLSVGMLRPPGWTEQRRDFFLTDPIRIDAEGCLTVPGAPGLGAQIDPTALTHRPDPPP